MNTTNTAIELAEKGARANAEQATKEAIAAKKYASDDQPWCASDRMREAKKYLAIAETFAIAAGSEEAQLQAAGAANIVKAAAEAHEESEKRWLDKQRTEALRLLIDKATK